MVRAKCVARLCVLIFFELCMLYGRHFKGVVTFDQLADQYGVLLT
jgi:hypothetical protein